MQLYFYDIQMFVVIFSTHKLKQFTKNKDYFFL